MKRSKVKVRVPRPIRRMGTEIHQDSRTRRARSRSEMRRLAVQQGLDIMADDFEAALDELRDLEDYE